MTETDEHIALRTAIGVLEIQLFSREAPLASQAFLGQYHSGAWDAARFCRVDAGALYFGVAAPTPQVQDPIERHSRLQFQRRGVVAFARGTTDTLVFSRGAGAVPPVGSIFGCVAPESLYILESIAARPSRDGNLLFPVSASIKTSSAHDPAQTGSKRRRVRIHLKDESDDDELPQASAKVKIEPAPPEPDKRAQVSQSASDTDTRAGTTRDAAMSHELQSLIAFENRLRMFRSAS